MPRVPRGTHQVGGTENCAHFSTIGICMISGNDRKDAARPNSNSLLGIPGSRHIFDLLLKLDSIKPDSERAGWSPKSLSPASSSNARSALSSHSLPSTLGAFYASCLSIIAIHAATIFWARFETFRLQCSSHSRRSFDSPVLRYSSSIIFTLSLGTWRSFMMRSTGSRSSRAF